MKEFVGIFNPIHTNLTPFYTDKSVDIYILTTLDKHFLGQIIEVDFKFGSELFKWLVDQQRYDLCINLLKRGFNDDISSILPSIQNYELYTNCVLFYNMKLSISQHPNLLVSAINAGSLSIVKYLIQQPSNTNSDVSSGILETCKTGQHDILSLLLKHKHQPNTQYLYTAIQFNHIVVVRKLIGIGINYIEKNYHCLTLAAKYGHLDIFAWLFEYIQQRPPFKNPTLSIAITNAVNEACLNNQVAFLLLVFTNKFKTIETKNCGFLN